MNAPLPHDLLPPHERRPVPAVMLDALRERFGERCSTAAAVREQHGRDESPFPVTPPDVVVFCETTEDVAFTVAQASAHAVPVIPFGVGSSLEGHLLAVQGGVSIDLSRMTRVVRVNAEDLTVTVEAGVTREQLNREGTLGVMTEVTLKLYPLPEAVSAAICHFSDIAGAVDATIQIIQMGVPIARCELLDANAVRFINIQSKLGLREQPLLLMEFHGSEAGVKEQAETVQAITADLGGEDFQWASTPEERTRLWTARHKAYFAGMSSNPGCRTVTTDTCVPISRLAEIIDASVSEADASGLPYYIVGHVGDGNFHLAYMVKDGDAQERALAERLSMQMVHRAIALEGTCTGEHGIGLHKMGFLVDEAGAGSVALMREIKRAFDPKNIMNPGKIFAW